MNNKYNKVVIDKVATEDLVAEVEAEVAPEEEAEEVAVEEAVVEEAAEAAVEEVAVVAEVADMVLNGNLLLNSAD